MMPRFSTPAAVLLLATLAALSTTGAVVFGCATVDQEGDSSQSAVGSVEMFTCQDAFHGKFGVLPKKLMLPNGATMPAEGTPEYAAIMDGRCTWVQDTGGTERLFRKLAVKTDGLFDFVLFLDTNPQKYKGSAKHAAGKTLSRGARASEIGVVNEPGCRQATAPDAYGLFHDVCPHDEHATGIVGVRKTRNPNFNPQKWDLNRYIDDRTIEPPYLVGVTCGACHVSFNPNNPPANLAEPTWDNLDAHIGNQYLHEGRLFGYQLDDGDFTKQVTETQQRGTSDTSRIATDHINNPGAINGVFNLGGRLAYTERMNDGHMADVPRVLKDGADSVGVVQAMLRVHVNIGMCSEQWLAKHDALTGADPQQPLDIGTLQRECPEYPVIAQKMSNQALFLSQAKPFKLAQEKLADEATIGRGAMAFAKACATCHSSKQPPGKGGFDQTTGGWQMSDQAIGEWFLSQVVDASGKANPSFLENNYLADDDRYPVGYLQTNAARSLATNALPGHVWEQFSSATYKEQQHVPATLTVSNPINGGTIDVHFGKGVGFYRTPALTSLWSSAPFLHNNSLGSYSGDPSVHGRLAAFDDAAHQLLWPATRTNMIKVTDRDTMLALPYWPDVRIQKGAPVNVFAHLDPRNLTTKAVVAAYAVSSLVSDFSPSQLTTILGHGQAPDLIENKGHYFGSELDASAYRRLTDAERQDLLEYLKTF